MGLNRAAEFASRKDGSGGRSVCIERGFEFSQVPVSFRDCVRISRRIRFFPFLQKSDGSGVVVVRSHGCLFRAQHGVEVNAFMASTSRDDTKPLTLGLFQEPVRRFLAGERREFPADTAVTVIVCTDKRSREAWFLPGQADDIWYHDIRFLAFSVRLRITLGKSIPSVLRYDSCHARGKRIHLGNCEHQTVEEFGNLVRGIKLS